MVRRLALVAVLLATGCIDRDNTLINFPVEVQAVVIDSGDRQVGAEGQPLAQPITAHILMSDGSLDDSHAIHVKIVSGNGSVTVGSNTASGNNNEVVGDANGKISLTWTLGPASENQIIRLYVQLAEVISVDATATSQAAS